MSDIAALEALPTVGTSETTKVVPSICRNCLAYCPILVTVEGGRAIKVTGDPYAPAFDGYTCPKGRALPAQHNDPARLLHCLRRDPAGVLERVASATAMDEVAERVRGLIARHGPQAIAMYTGTGPVSHPAGDGVSKAWMRAIGSAMSFSAATIDKPAEATSVALHGNWHAGLQSFETADTWIIVGANPVLAKSNGAPLNNPGQRIKEAVTRGLKLIVIDPRRTETAKRAEVHLQLRPGEDALVLAGLVHLILQDDLHDAAFLAENAVGLLELRARVAPCTPAFVEEHAGVPAERLRAAARVFGQGRRGGVICSTGPSFSTHSNLTFYLALCLNTLCGRWARAGDPAPYPNVLLPSFVPRAQPYAPYPVFGQRAMRVAGLRENASGLPTAALADEILMEGDGQIKALFVVGGNPVLAWPDQARTEAALKRLELLVVFDYQMTATASFAHFVVPPPLSLELPGSTQKVESKKYNGVNRGYSIPWAQYTPAIAEVPAGADVIDDAGFFFGLAQRMDLALELVSTRGVGPHQEGPTRRFALDMSRAPTVDQMIAWTCEGSRVPLDEVKAHPHGALFDLDVVVQPREAGYTAMLQLADPMMMAELTALLNISAIRASDPAFPLRMISRRANQFMNSVGQTLAVLHKGERGTPAHMHPDDLLQLGLREGQVVEVRSPHGRMVAVVDSDSSLRVGTVSIVHGFGGPVSVENEPHAAGSVNRLIGMDERDPITGIPRMSAVPIAVSAVETAS